MIKLSRVLTIGGLFAALPALAVYAPIPETEQERDLKVSVRAGLAHDSNIFGAAANEVDSAIWTLAPRIDYTASVTDQTFLSAGYGLALDRFDRRPGDKLVDSHDLGLRLAHAFSKVTTLDVNESYLVSRNPESLLAGVPLNTDQSFTRNQLDGRFVTPVAPKTGVTAKARSTYFKYRNDSLGRNLDRSETLLGLTSSHALVPELKLVAEYRFQDVSYRRSGDLKDKASNYLMAGLDYDVAQKTSVSARLGFERRSREAERNITSPYAEFSAKHDYAPKSYLAGGYVYTLEETSDVVRFTDAKVHRIFGSAQHALSALVVASASVTVEPSKLQGRRGVADVDETTVRSGVALTYLPSKNWSASATFDLDRVRSDDPSRRLRRTRIALGATYAF